MIISKLIMFYRFVIFKTPIDNSSWSAEDVLKNCPEMSDQKSGCLIINIKPSRDAIIWYGIKKSYLDISYVNYKYLLKKICISFYNTVRHPFDCRYNEDTFIEKGIQYGDMFIKGTAREPPDFVVSEVCVSNVHCSVYVYENL